jgi:Rrf2 family protein
MISTRGRYALRVLIDLAESYNGSLIPMKTIAERQGISAKYMEHIVKLLMDLGLIEGVKGKCGGYRRLRDPKDCTVGEILRATEVDMAPVACLGKNAEPCPRREGCRTIGMWEGYQKLTNEYFDGITLADLCQ